MPEEDLYRLLVEAITDCAIYMLDPFGNVSSWNAGARRFKGYTAEEILGSNFACFYTEIDRRLGLPGKALEIARREGRFESEGWRLRKDGRTFWAHVVIQPIFSSTGSFRGYAKITRDLSERRAAERSAARSEANFTRLVQAVSEHAIYMLDPQGRVATWNAGAQKIYDYRPEDIIGKHFSFFMTTEDRERGEAHVALERSLSHGRYEHEGWRVRRDGTTFLANVLIEPILESDATIVGFATIIRDLTERKRSAAELERVREQLFESRKLEALGQLTGGVAHDFNNLLSAVLGSLELARKYSVDRPKLIALIEIASEAAKRGAMLTKRMLAFARRQDLRPEPIDLAALVEGVGPLIRQSLSPLIMLETCIEGGTMLVSADRNHLELALLNVLTNARDAMPTGGSVLVSARRESVPVEHATSLSPGEYICLSVTDTGIGMDASTLARATEPFFTTKNVGLGTGLGLSMIHGLAEQLGGRLVLRSELGRGTTVDVWLPAAKARPAIETALEAGTATNWVRPLDILVVDDDRDVLRIISAMLENLGHNVRSMCSATEALDFLRNSGNCDLCVTDYCMPDMNGLELIEVVKLKRPSIQFVLASGHADVLHEDFHKVRKLAKPFTQDDLARCIYEIVPSIPAYVN